MSDFENGREKKVEDGIPGVRYDLLFRKPGDPVWIIVSGQQVEPLKAAGKTSGYDVQPVAGPETLMLVPKVSLSYPPNTHGYIRYLSVNRGDGQFPLKIPSGYVGIRITPFDRNGQVEDFWTKVDGMLKPPSNLIELDSRRAQETTSLVRVAR